MAIPLTPLGCHGFSGRMIETPLLRVCRTEYSPGLRLDSHAHERANLCAVLSGDFEEVRGSRSSSLKPDQVLLKPEGFEHANVFGSRGAHVLNIDLLEPLNERLEGAGLLVREPVVSGEPHLVPLCREIEAELVAPNDLSALVVEANVFALIAAFCRSRRRREARGRPPWLEHARELVQDQATSTVRIGELAREVGVSTGHLSKKFRDHYHCSIAEYVRRCRVRLAIQRLRDPRVPLAEIALRVGFCDQSHFCNTFKRITGSTPAEYRRMLA